MGYQYVVDVDGKLARGHIDSGLFLIAFEGSVEVEGGRLEVVAMLFVEPVLVEDVRIGSDVLALETGVDNLLVFFDGVVASVVAKETLEDGGFKSVGEEDLPYIPRLKVELGVVGCSDVVFVNVWHGALG